MSTASGLPSCRQLAEQLDTSHRIGQLFMVGTEAATADVELRAVVRENHVGSVLYLGSSPRSLESTARMSAQVKSWADGDVGILLAADQEGGSVQRLAGQGFSQIPSATSQGRTSDASLRANWVGWGRQLRQAGVQYNLAPVADVVPTGLDARNAPVGALDRNYGTDDATVGAKSAAVVQGLAQAGVASSLKHYPGLGRVSTNTDFGVAHDDATTLDDVASFRPAMAAGASSVMISSTVYSKIDPDVPGVFSSKIITDSLRGSLGWNKVVISDDLGVAQAVAEVPARERAVRFLAAGGDLVVNASPSLTGAMVQGVAERAANDPAFAAQLTEHATRVLELKASVGAAHCS